MEFPQQSRSSGKWTREPAARAPRWSELAVPGIDAVAFFEWDVRAGTTWYSEEWKKVIQCDDYDGRRADNRDWWIAHVHPDDMPVLQRTCLAILAGFVERSDVTFRIKLPDNSWRWLLSRATVTEKDADGSPRIVSGICLELSDILQNDKVRRSASTVSDFDYHSMLENSPDLFIRLDRNLTPSYVNPAVVAYLRTPDGVRTATDTAKSLKISSKLMQQIKRNIERVFKKRSAVREEITFSLPDGSEVSGECSFWPEFDPEGNVQYAMVQFRDQTEQRRTEQRAMLNEQRLEALYRLTCMENATESEVLNFVMESVLKLTRSKSGFFFIPTHDDPDRGYMFWSEDHYERLSRSQLPNDYLPRDILLLMTEQNGKRMYRGISNGDGVSPLYVAFGNNMPVMRAIVAPGTENGRVVCIAGVCNKESDYEESDLLQLETFINSAWLILRRRHFINELQAAKAAAEAANKAKDAFLANVSHELRTPLNGVLSMLQLIDALPLGDLQREYLTTALDSGRALLRIISDLLDFSCMESGKMPLALEEFDCTAAVSSALSMFEDEARKKQLQFTCSIDPAIPSRLMGDEARIRQIIFNLVGNSLKFTAEGGIEVSCERIAPPARDTVAIALTVRDTGIGIPKDKLSSIFEAFSQMESAHRRKYSGTGLGLSIVKHLVTLMGGRVTVESTLGLGTTVKCVLFFEQPQQRRTPQAAVTPADDAPIQGLSILVAEDDQVGSFAIRSFLQRFGHRVVCVEDGRQALEALKIYPFDCVFTDIEMPHVDGLELVRYIRTNNADAIRPSNAVRSLVRETFPEVSPDAAFPIASNTLIVAVSAHSMIGDKERFLKQGVSYYISKPILQEELHKALQFVARELQNRPAA